MSEDRPTRTALDVAQLQLRALEAWHEARRLAERAAEVGSQSRETRMDLDRRLDVVRAQHAAIVERTDTQLRASLRLMRELPPRRAVIAHRNEWFAGRLARGLEEQGVEVLARLENGAEAVGVAVAEQPDLVVVEERLAMLSGEDVVREVRGYAPATLIAAQVSYEDGVGAMLAAGADRAYTRRTPPAEVARDLLALLTRSTQLA